MLTDKMSNVVQTRAEVCTAGDSSCLMHIGGGLSQAAHRDPHGPPGRDPGLDGGALVTTFLGMPTAPAGVGMLRGTEPFPAAARAALADTQLRRNIGVATRTIRAKRAAVVGEVARLGRASRGRPGDQGSHHGAAWTSSWSGWRRRSPHAAAPCTGRPTPTRRTAIVTELVKAAGADEVVKVKSMATQEIGLNEALAAAGIAAYETDLAELIVQLAEDRPSHILVPAIHLQPGRDPGDLPARDGRRRPGPGSTTPRSSRRRPGATCAASSSPPRSPSAAPTSRSPRPGRWPSWSPRATAGCA